MKDQNQQQRTESHTHRPQAPNMDSSTAENSPQQMKLVSEVFLNCIFRRN